jgi:hypothetical protein
MKTQINEIKRMQQLAGIIKENQGQEINSIDEMYNFLENTLKDYINETKNIAGLDLDWDGDGSNMGISKNELINDFIGYLQNNM